MLLRWISASPGIPLFVGICLWGKLPFAIGILCLAVLGLLELIKTLRAQGIRPNPLLAFLGLAGPGWVLADAAWQQNIVVILVGAALVSLAGEVLHAARTGELNAGRNTAYGLLCALYIGLFGGLAMLRGWTGHTTAGSYVGMEKGLALVVTAACCVWATDSAALFVGKFCGKRKLAPRLSPGKTVEGAAGGLAGGVVIGGLFGHWFLGSAALGLVIGSAAGLVGQVGDLYESALKREAGVKDFGAVFPGHGGVLDRFDSLLFVAPLIYLVAWFWRF